MPSVITKHDAISDHQPLEVPECGCHRESLNTPPHRRYSVAHPPTCNVGDVTLSRLDVDSILSGQVATLGEATEGTWGPRGQREGGAVSVHTV